MRIYLDNCCYNRPFDDQSQERIHIESEAILEILKKGRKDLSIIGSQVLELEMSRITDKMKKEKVISLYSVVTSSIPYTDNILARSQEILAQSNIRAFDALHIASAESTKIDIMLTTDDKLGKACMKLKLHIKVMNPLRFIMEVMEYE